MLAVIYVSQILIQKKSYAMILGYSVFEIATGSMEPAVSIGDKVLIKETKNIKEGDIVIYESNNTLVCHRIHQIIGNRVICKGDNNNVEDEEISTQEIVGKVIHIFQR